MTPEERKAWAHGNLDRYLREIDVRGFQEFLTELADVGHLEDRLVGHLEDRLADAEGAIEDHERRLDLLTEETESLSDEMDGLVERLEAAS